MPNYYYLAEVEGGLNFAELWNHGKLTVMFTASIYDKRIKEGHDIWDEINFETDILQPVDLMNGTLDIMIFNGSVPSLSPTIEATAPMEV